MVRSFFRVRGHRVFSRSSHLLSLPLAAQINPLSKRRPCDVFSNFWVVSRFFRVRGHRVFAARHICSPCHWQRKCSLSKRRPCDVFSLIFGWLGSFFFGCGAPRFCRSSHLLSLPLAAQMLLCQNADPATLPQFLGG